MIDNHWLTDEEIDSAIAAKVDAALKRNAAGRDAHLTRADVEALRAEGEDLVNRAQRDADRGKRLLTVADKLVALLPPE